MSELEDKFGNYQHIYHIVKIIRVHGLFQWREE